MRLISVLAAVFLTGIISPLFGESFLLPEVIDQPIDISSSMEMCRFKVSEAAPDDLQKIKKAWRKVGKDGISLGYSDDTLMFRFFLKNNRETQRKLYLELDFSTLDKIVLYMPDGKGEFVRKVSGDMIPFSEREVADRYPIFIIKVPPGETEWYINLQSTGALKFHLNIYSTEAYTKHRAWSLPLLWILLGWLMLMIIVNFFIFLSVREKIFLYFIFFILSILLHQFTVRGLSFQYLWPESPWWNWRSVPFMMGLVLTSAAIFTRVFFDAKKKYPVVNELLKYLCVAPGIIIVLLSMRGPIRILVQVGFYSFLIYTVLSIALIILGLIRRDRASWFFASGMIVLLLSLPLSILGVLGFLPQTPLTMYSSDVALTFFSLIMSLGLGDRINTMKKSLEKSQIKINQQNEELQAANEELQAANEEFEAQNEELAATCGDLEKSELKFREIAELLPQTIFEMNSIGVLTYVNQYGFETTGYSREDFKRGLNALDLFVPEDREKIIRRMTELANDDSIAPGEYTMQLKNGSVRSVLIYSRPIKTDGELQGYRGVLIDLTERKKAEALMMQTEKMMTVGGLAAGMAHEINNPLGIILQGIQNTRRRFESDRKKNRETAEKLNLDMDVLQQYMEEKDINTYLEGIENAGKRASKIIKNMLAFSRKSSKEKEAVDINRLTDEVIELAENDYDLKKQYDFKHIHIERDYPQDLPSFPVIRTEIEQVLLNIIKNSAQAICEHCTGEDGPTIRIKTGLKDEMITIDISDNGPGIDEETQKHIFEPFFSTKESEGTGLGLSVSYFIITGNHRGSISVESVKGNGATFHIELPLS